MKLSLFKVTILFSIILATTAYSQQQGLSFNFLGGGARSEGMGQAFLAVSNDGTAGGWNPAGLQVHERTLMSFSYGFLQPKGDYNYFASGSENGNSYGHGGSIGALNYLHIMSPIRVKGHHVVLNGGYTRNFDVYYMFGESLIKNILGDDPNAVYERKGGINSINLGFGTRIYKQLSFGLMTNIYNGSVVTDENRYFSDIDYIYPNNFGVAVYESNVRVIDSTKYTGFNATLGLLWSSDAFSAAVVVRTPFDLKGESDTTQYTISTLNGVPISSDPYNLIHDLGYNLYKSDTNYIDDITSRLEMPLMVGFGLGYKLKDNWLVASDVEFKKFDGKRIKSLQSRTLSVSGETTEEYTDTVVVPNWSNVMQFRIGTEYILATGFGEIPIRAGFRNEAFPHGDISNFEVDYKGGIGSSVNDSTRVFYLFDYKKDDKITGYSLAFGTGIHWSQIQLDMAYTYTSYKQGIYSQVWDPVNNKFTTELRAENNWKNHHMNFTFTGYF